MSFINFKSQYFIETDKNLIISNNFKKSICSENNNIYSNTYSLKDNVNYSIEDLYKLVKYKKCWINIYNFLKICKSIKIKTINENYFNKTIY